MKFYEKLTILIILFLGVTIGTAGIIGVYVKTVNASEQEQIPEGGTSIILE